MKKILFCFFILSSSLKSQTYISPIIGHDRLSIVDERTSDSNNLDYFDLQNKTEQLQSLIFGAELEQLFFKQKLSLSLQYLITNKKLDAHVGGIIPYTGLKFRNTRNYIFLKWYPTENIFTGIGWGSHKISCVTEVTREENNLRCNNDDLNKTKTNDYSVKIGTQFNNIVVSLQYSFSEDVLLDNSNTDFTNNQREPFFEQHAAFTLFLAYRFKIFNQIDSPFGKKKSGCPTNF